MRFFILLLFFVELFGSTLHLATSTNPARLNPILATDSSSSEIAEFLFNGLVKYDKDLKNIVGDLAEDFYFEDDTTVVFKLRKNVFWHDGEPMRAKDVVFTYETIISDKISSPYSANFRFVKSVKAIDPFTVEVKYTQAYFKALEIWMMGILPYHLLKDEENLMSASFNTAPIGTGPYVLEQLEHSKNIILRANEFYFIHKPKIERISFHVIADPMIHFLMLKSGSLDLGSIEAMAYERNLDTEFFKNFSIYEDISHSYDYLGFNLKNKKFQDPRVRQALSLAIDREELVEILFFEHAQVCKGPFLPRTPSFNKEVKAPTQDLQKAKELLSQAGYNENNKLHFEIATSNASTIRPYAAEILQYQLQKIGVEVELRVMEWQAFLNMVVFPHEFDTILLGWRLAATPDPFLTWHSTNDKKGGFNFIGFESKKVDTLIDRTVLMTDKDKISVANREIFASIVEQNPYLFLYIPNTITAVSKKIKNVEPTLSGIWHNYIEWEIEE